MNHCPMSSLKHAQVLYLESGVLGGEGWIRMRLLAGAHMNGNDCGRGKH